MDGIEIVATVTERTRKEIGVTIVDETNGFSRGAFNRAFHGVLDIKSDQHPKA